MLPDNSLIYTHINMRSTSQRPDLQEHVEFQLAHFVSEEELPLAEELLASTGVRTVTLSIPHEGYEWVGIIRGDLLAVASTLGSSPESGEGLSINVIESFAGEDIYALVRTRSTGRQSELYMAIIDDETLAVSPHFAAVLDVIARRHNPLQLPHALSAMIEEWGLGDLLQVLNIPFFGIGATMQGTPLDRQRLFAYHATLSEGSSTVFRALQQYDDEAQALAAAAWLEKQQEPRWRDIGWGSSVSVEQWQQRGATAYGEVTVPDADVPSLVQGN